jgi:hypothetical protein
MADSVLGKSAKFGIGATPVYVAGISTISWNPGAMQTQKSNLLEEERPSIYPGSITGSTIKLNCEKKTADTNGQEALVTAYSAKTKLNFTLAPEGSTAGSKKITGNCYVTEIGEETYEKDKIVGRAFVLEVSGDFVLGVYP